MAATRDQTAHSQDVHFDDLAVLFERFSAITDPTYRPWIEQAVPGHGQRAVDLGCGSGRFLDVLADRYQSVLAVDIDDRAVDLARAKYPLRHVDCQVRSLLDVSADQDGPFDLVFSINTIHHLNNHKQVLPHVRSLVAPGGHAVIVDIVDTEGQWRSLDWQIADAFRAAEAFYRQRNRADDAIDVLRLRLHPAWLEHVRDDIPLSREAFHRVYGAFFPGAILDDLNRVAAAMRWQAPV